MSVKNVLVAGLILAAVASPGRAQGSGGQSAAGAIRAPFTGAYAGPEAGAHEHHFYLRVTDLRTGETNGRYYRGWGVGGGAFIGYDFEVSSRVRGGIEAGVSLGGNNPVARFSDGTDYSQHPRYGLRATGKVGYLLSDRLLAYGTFGYGGHRYRITGTATVTDSPANGWGSSFTIGAGFEYRASDRMGVRLDFRHLDNQMSHLLIGLPIRF
jgi:outer membrane immunogenic protein